jgi:hypothetical protein
VRFLVKNTQQGRNEKDSSRTPTLLGSNAGAIFKFADVAGQYYVRRLCCVFFTNKPTDSDNRFDSQFQNQFLVVTDYSTHLDNVAVSRIHCEW